MLPTSDKNVKEFEDELAVVCQAQRERLLHIDFKLYFLGSINRTDLVSRFGIKEAAASRDLSLYKSLASKNIEYDTKAKTYIQRDGFVPLFDYSGNQILTALMHGFGDDFVGNQKPLVPCETPTQLNFPNLSTLACITRAIHNNWVLKIKYRSLSSGVSEREIVPFALIDNGLRWHVRAYDRDKNRFSDFVINRIESPQLLGRDIPFEHTKSADNQWNRIVELLIVPHPRLKHPDTIAFEYSMIDGKLEVQVRAATAGYLLRKWNIDCSQEHVLDTAETHLWLKNTETLYGVESARLAPGYETLLGAK